MLQICNLNIKLNDFTLKGINLSINDGEYFIILGPTGAGKTVFLESIAGLHPIASGRILLNGSNITDVPPETRGIGIVYQDQSLFPHMTAKENIIFSLRIRKSNPRVIEEALSWIEGLINIGHLWSRFPNTLSGGERQKVALSRALIMKPGLLLLDEPLSALDPETRENMRDELSQIQQNLHITTIHVTHDFEEAISVGQRIAVLGNGKIQQVGTPEQIFRKPETEFIARFAMARNIFNGKVLHNDAGQAIFEINGLHFQVDSIADGNYHAVIRPEDVLISNEPADGSRYNCFYGKISRIIDKGSVLLVNICLPLDIQCLVTRHMFDELELATGNNVYVSFKKSSAHLFK